MSSEHDGKVAIVTAPATGIGTAIASVFGAADARVVSTTSTRLPWPRPSLRRSHAPALCLQRRNAWGTNPIRRSS